MTTRTGRQKQVAIKIRADYDCPQCGGRLQSDQVANQFRCQRCGKTISEALSETYQRVRSFFQAACGEEGL